MRYLSTKKKTWLQSPILAVVLVLFIIWGLISVTRAGLKQREAIQLRNDSQKQLVELEQKQVVLDHKIEDLSTEKGLEAEVRQRYRVVKPGEHLVIVVDNEDTSQAPGQKSGFWAKLRMFVGL
jgi:cell division protein FtsB